MTRARVRGGFHLGSREVPCRGRILVDEYRQGDDEDGGCNEHVSGARRTHGGHKVG